MDMKFIHSILRNEYTFSIAMVVWFIAGLLDGTWSLLLSVVSLSVAVGCFWSYYKGLQDGYKEVGKLLVEVKILKEIEEDLQ